MVVEVDWSEISHGEISNILSISYVKNAAKIPEDHHANMRKLCFLVVSNNRPIPINLCGINSYQEKFAELWAELKRYLNNFAITHVPTQIENSALTSPFF